MNEKNRWCLLRQIMVHPLCTSFCSYVLELGWVSYHYENIKMCSVPEITKRKMISTLLRDGNPSSCIAISLTTSVTIQVNPQSKPRGQSTLISIIGHDLAPLLPFGVVIYVLSSCGDSQTCLNSQQLRLCIRLDATSQDGSTDQLVYRCNCHPACDSVFVHMMPQITHTSLQLCEIEM